jgi:hypothetical protein
MFLAGWRRRPEALGVLIDYIDAVGGVKVMNMLMEVEKRYENLGQSMLGTFFSGDLRENEKKHWDAIAEEWERKKLADKGIKPRLIQTPHFKAISRQLVDFESHR